MQAEMEGVFVPLPVVQFNGALCEEWGVGLSVSLDEMLRRLAKDMAKMPPGLFRAPAAEEVGEHDICEAWVPLVVAIDVAKANDSELVDLLRDIDGRLVFLTYPNSD